MLEENFEYIKTIQRRQEEGQAEECLQWQKKLQDNLTFLAKIADAQPAPQVPTYQPILSALLKRGERTCCATQLLRAMAMLQAVESVQLDPHTTLQV